MAELESTDQARQALERALELAETLRDDPVLDAIGRFLLAHSHARPAQARVRLMANGQVNLFNRLVDLNRRTIFRVDLPGLQTMLQLEIEPEPG